MAAATIEADAGPCQAPLVSPETTEPYEDAAEYNSSARPSQAAAAVSSGPGPAPAYIRAELISGGNNPKSIASMPGPITRWLCGQAQLDPTAASVLAMLLPAVCTL